MRKKYQEFLLESLDLLDCIPPAAEDRPPEMVARDYSNAVFLMQRMRQYVDAMNRLEPNILYERKHRTGKYNLEELTGMFNKYGEEAEKEMIRYKAFINQRKSENWR